MRGGKEGFIFILLFCCSIGVEASSAVPSPSIGYGFTVSPIHSGDGKLLNRNGPYNAIDSDSNGNVYVATTSNQPFRKDNITFPDFNGQSTGGTHILLSKFNSSGFGLLGVRSFTLPDVDSGDEDIIPTSGTAAYNIYVAKSSHTPSNVKVILIGRLEAVGGIRFYNAKTNQNFTISKPNDFGVPVTFAVGMDDSFNPIWTTVLLCLGSAPSSFDESRGFLYLSSALSTIGPRVRMGPDMNTDVASCNTLPDIYPGILFTAQYNVWNGTLRTLRCSVGDSDPSGLTSINAAGPSAVDSTGQFYLTAWCNGVLRWSNGFTAAATDVSSFTDAIFIASFNFDTMLPTWSKRFILDDGAGTGDGNAYISHMTTDAIGNLFLTFTASSTTTRMLLTNVTVLPTGCGTRMSTDGGNMINMPPSSGFSGDLHVMIVNTAGSSVAPSYLNWVIFPCLNVDAEFQGRGALIVDPTNRYLFMSIFTSVTPTTPPLPQEWSTYAIWDRRGRVTSTNLTGCCGGPDFGTLSASYHKIDIQSGIPVTSKGLAGEGYGSGTDPSPDIPIYFDAFADAKPFTFFNGTMILLGSFNTPVGKPTRFPLDNSTYATDFVAYTGTQTSVSFLPQTPTTVGDTMFMIRINDACSLLLSPCQNGGTCQSVSGTNDTSYICICLSGYSGVQCQTNINECASSPCMNDGGCVDGINSFSCTCISGYSGLLCQTNVNECLSVPCIAPGTSSCVDEINGFHCNCNAGYSGALCQFDINECVSEPCQHVSDNTMSDCPYWIACTSYASTNSPFTNTFLSEIIRVYPNNGTIELLTVLPDVYRCTSVIQDPRTRLIYLAGRTQNVGGPLSWFLFNINNLTTTLLDNTHSGQGLNHPSPNNGPFQSLAFHLPGDGLLYSLPLTTNPSNGQTFEPTLATVNLDTQILTVRGYTRLQELYQSVGFSGSAIAFTLDGLALYGSIEPGVDPPLLFKMDLQANVTILCSLHGDTVTNCGGSPRLKTMDFYNETTLLAVFRCGFNDAPSLPVFIDVQTCGVSAMGDYTSIPLNALALVGSTPNTAFRRLGQTCGVQLGCIDRVNGYECRCAPGYSGSLCQTEINECSSSPCLNGGTCTDGVNSYTCQCLSGYSGSLCQTNINECISNPCLNDGQCADQLNGYECICSSSLFTGIHCEMFHPPPPPPSQPRSSSSSSTGSSSLSESQTSTSVSASPHRNSSLTDAQRQAISIGIPLTAFALVVVAAVGAPILGSIAGVTAATAGIGGALAASTASAGTTATTTAANATASAAAASAIVQSGNPFHNNNNNNEEDETEMSSLILHSSPSSSL